MTEPGHLVRGRDRTIPGQRFWKMAAVAAFIGALGIWAIDKASPERAKGSDAQAKGSAGQVKAPASNETQSAPPERFDYLVREDYFAGLAGDQAALERAIKVCEEALAKNPKHAEALVWHGSGLMLRSRFAFQKGDIRNGAQWWERGLDEMDQAAGIEPSNIGVLIARGATLLGAARYAADPKQSKTMLEKGVRDYEAVLEMQRPYFTKLSPHARGELLFGLGSGWHQLGNADRARAYFRRVLEEGKGSGHEAQASQYLDSGALKQAQPMTCTGCHSK